MITQIIYRILQSLVVIFLLSIIVFSFIHIMPGDAALTMLGHDATQEQIDLLRKELGLDKPIIVQYTNWLFNALRGDFGRSIIYHESVADLIVKRLPVTVHLGLLAMILSLLISIPAGIISAIRRGGILDLLITIIANIGMSVPIFWLGVIGIYLFGLILGRLPTQGYISPFNNLLLSTKHAIMPVICLAVVPLASLTRQTRSSMLEVIQNDYIRTARSKGLNEKKVIAKHALKNAIIPVVTLLGTQTRNLFGGSVLVETVFNIPGMGRLLVSSVFDKDFPVVQGGILVIALIVMIANLIVDLSYSYFDPRVKIGKMEE